MKKFLIILVSIVLVFVLGVYFLGPMLFSNPTVVMADAFKQTFSANSGLLNCDIKLDQNGTSYAGNLKLQYERSDDGSSTKLHASANASVMSLPFSAECWGNYDTTDSANNIAIFSVPMLSDKYYVADLPQTSTAGATTLTAEQQKAITDSIAKNLPAINWSKKGDTYSATITMDKVYTLCEGVLTTLSSDANFTDYQDTFSEALDCIKSANDGTLAQKSFDISVTLANGAISNLALTTNLDIPNVTSALTDTSSDSAIATTLTISMDLTGMATTQSVTLPNLDESNSEYIGSDSSDSVIVYMDGTKADFTGYLQDGNLMLPARSLIESLGGTMTYNEDENGIKTVTGVLGDTTLVLQQDSTTATVNGTSQELVTAVSNTDGTEYVPARFIVEALGKSISAEKNAAGQTIVRIANN